MKSSKRRPTTDAMTAFALAVVSGALAGLGESWRAGNPRASMAFAGAVIGAFVGCGVALHFFALPIPMKRLIGAISGVVAGVACGVAVQWPPDSTAMAALVAAAVGAANPEWSRNATI